MLVDTLQAAFAGYTAFAPRGWTPPPPLLDRARIEDRLPREDAWCVIAEEAGRPAGHVALLEEAPDLAYLWMLFVREPWWGTGLAVRLHAMVVAEAKDRGYAAMRLVTPAAHARARAFYEREGWSTDGREEMDLMFGLELVEYRRPL